MIINVFRPDGTFYEVDANMPDTVPKPMPEPEPTTEEILNAMLGVTGNE